MEARKIPINRGSHVTGLYPSKKSPAGAVFYESGLQRDWISILDGDDSVIKIVEQPITVSYMDKDGKSQKYTPDILAHYNNRRPRLFEVKYQDILRKNIAEYREHYLAAAKYASREGWVFRIATERNIRKQPAKQPGGIIEGASSVRIIPNAEVIYREEVYRVIKVLDLSKILAKSVKEGKMEILQISDLRGNLAIGKYADDFPMGDRALENVSDEQWQDVERKYKLIAGILDNDGRSSRSSIKSAAANAEMSEVTIYRWLARYSLTNQATALLPRERSDKGGSRLSDKAEVIIADALESEFLTSQRRSVKSVWRTIRKRCLEAGLTPPHENTLRNRIKTLSAKKVTRRRFGSAATKKLNMAPGRFPSAHRALDVAQIDHSKLDIIVVDEKSRQPIGRPWLSLVMDIYSRAVLGFYLSLDAPGASTAGRCLVNAILPKEGFLGRFPKISGEWPCWGKMRKLHMDNAGEFRGEMMRRACVNHSIGLEWRPVRHPEYGGHIERIMGTVMREIHELPGTTFNAPKMRGDIDPEDSAAMSVAELEEWLAVFIVEVYHCRIHSETGRSPIALYEESILQGDLPGRESDEERLRIDFLPVVTRSVQKRGIVIHKIHYYNPCLNSFFGSGKPISFRWDPHNLSRIYWYDDAIKKYIIIPYADVRRPPINIWDLRKINKELFERSSGDVNEDDIFASYERMRALEDVGKKETKRARRERERRRLGKTTAVAKQKSKTIEEIDAVENIAITPYEEVETIR